MFQVQLFGFTGVKETVVFSAIGDFQRAVLLNDNSNCGTTVGRFDIKGTYAVLGNSANTSDGTKDINLTISKYDLTVLSDSLATVLNKTKYCGQDNWTVNQKVSLIGLNCVTGNVGRGDTVYELFLTDKNSLCFSDQLGVLGQRTAAKRPTKIDRTRQFVKR